MSSKRLASFVEMLSESKLLEPAQVDEIRKRSQGKDVDRRALAKFLLQRGWLTHFQINEVAQGRGKDLALGPYRILDRLGAGGMGVVFKAHHQVMNRIVALKVINQERLSNANSVSRFFREVQAAAQLVHPNIVLAYDAGQVENTYFFAMEYVDGIDLARLVKQSGPLPWARACDYIRQAALGLQHAHERGLVHRDIKPANLLLGGGEGRKEQEERKKPHDTAAPAPVVKILDMGLARLATPTGDNAVTRDGTVIGTPEFLAPEQALNAHAADIRADIYSLGCTFYYLLAGRPPFQTNSLTEILLKHQMEQPTPLERLRADLPAEVVAVVGKMMAKRPEDRYQTPAEVAEALDSLGRQASGLRAAAPRSRLPGGTYPEAAGGPAEELRLSSVAGNSEDTLEPSLSAQATNQTWEFAEVRSSRALPRQSRRWLKPALIGFFLPMPILIGLAIYFWPKNANHSETPDYAKTGGLAQGDNQKAPGLLDSTARKRPPEPIISVDPTPPAPTAQPPKPTQVTPPPPAPPGGVGGEILRFQGHTAPVACVAMSPDGQHAISGGLDRVIRFWDITSGKEIRRLEGHQSPVHCLVFSYDGRQAVTGGGQQQFQNGKFVPVDCTVRLWNVESGNEIRNFQGHTGQVMGVAISRDGRRILSCSHDKTVRLWDAKTGKELNRVEARAALWSVGLSSDGRRAVFGDGADLVFWDVMAWREIRRFQSLQLLVSSVAISADGRRALSGSSAPTNRNGRIEAADATVRLLDLDAGTELRRFQAHEGPVTSVAFSPDGRLAVTGSGITSIVQGRSVPVDCTVRLWEVDSGRELRRFTGHSAPVRCVAISSDGRHVLSGSYDGTVRVWEATPTPVVRHSETSAGRAFPLVAKAAVPDEAKQAAAEKLIKQVFKDDYAKKSASSRLALAGKLLQKAAETNDDPAARFVLLRQARDLAAQAGEPDLALQAVDELSHQFAIDALEMKIAALKMAGRWATSATASQFLDSCFAVMDELIAVDNYASALHVAELAASSMRSLSVPALAARAEARGKTVAEVQKDYEQVKPAAATLDNNPDDPAANLALGKFLCLKKEDWDKGLPMLAKGGDERLKELADKELSHPDDPAEQAELADGWWDLAKAKSGPEETRLLRRAYHWYQQAAPYLKGLSKTKVDQRMAELERKGVARAQQLVILHARYGADDGWLNVKPIVQRLVKRSKLTMKPSDLPPLDPARGKPKALVIVYRYGGKTYLSVTGQSEAVELPLLATPNLEREKVPPGQPLTILYAKWGADTTWVDVTAQVQKKVHDSRLMVNAAREFGDPAFGKYKSLIIVYRYSGRIYLSTTGQAIVTVIDPSAKK